MGKKICNKCNKERVWGQFKFTGKGKAKKGKKGTYRSEVCLLCGGDK